MNCPQCKGYRLQPVELELGLVAAGCSRCNGALLSLINYRFWVDQNVDLKPLESKEKPEQLNDSEKAQLCPKCDRLMTKYRINTDSKNKLDLCGRCDEVWLDNGEWQLLVSLDVHDQLPSIFTEAWQINIRKKRQDAYWQEHFEKLLGKKDFAKLNDMKQWIERHPERQALKHFLITKFG